MGRLSEAEGKQIVFESVCDGQHETYVMNADVTHQTNLANNSADDEHPTWSADGKLIAFKTQRNGHV